MGQLVPFVLFFPLGYYTNPLNKGNPEDLTPLSGDFECPKFLWLIVSNLCLEDRRLCFSFKDKLGFKVKKYAYLPGEVLPRRHVHYSMPILLVTFSYHFSKVGLDREL